ncbi:MFS transporter [Halosegnis marinus]|uniref:MFS transporter n=1 Tax=Halosegnis marinus TaxID=3034023 RepID=A0ABD5ZSA9_9EURY
MLAHGLVHTYELTLPILAVQTVWAAEFPATTLPVLGTVPTTLAVLGIVVSAGYALFGLGALPGGVLADAYGSRPLIVACLLGMGGSFVLLAFAPNLVVVALCLVIWGAAASVYHPAGLALISKGVEERGTAFAYHGIAGNLGIALGPLAAAVMLLFTNDWRLTVGVLGVPAILAAGFALRIDVDEAAAADDEDGDARASGSVASLDEFLSQSRTLLVGPFLLVFAVVMLSGLYYRGFLTFLPELLSGFDSLTPVEVAGRSLSPYRYVYVGLLMAGVVGQYVGGRLTDRIEVERGLALGYGSLGVLALVFLPLATAGLLPLLAVCAVMGVALFVVQPFYQATVAEYTPAGARGLSYGYTYLGVFGIGALGGAVAGGILTAANAAALFAVLAAFGFVAGAIGLYLSR